MVKLPSNMPKWITDHIELYLRDPEAGHMWDSSLGGGEGLLPTLLLTTRGRKSGDERVLPLIYRKVDDKYVIIASKGGAPAHPSWYLNLKAHPECDIQVASEHFTAVAREAEGDERKMLWDKLVEIYSPYVDYQNRTRREIPVMVLEAKR